MALNKLFEPCRIGTLEARNRILMPPISTKFGSSEGFVTEQMMNYYEVRAKGGTGTIVVEDAMIESTVGRHMHHDLCIDDDKFLPGLTQLASRIKAHGARALLHLSHGGARAGRENLTKGKPAVAPSSIIPHPGYTLPRELGIDEIEDLIGKYVAGAIRAKRAGFDGVGLHCSHGYLLNEFISPVFNKRTDEYGKDQEGRLRIVLRIIQGIRENLGDYPLIARISGEEPLEGGLTLEDMKWVAHRLEQAGLDALLVSRGSAFIPPNSKSNFIFAVAPMRLPRGCMVYLAEGIKQAVKIPVIAVNRINDPVLAEQILREGKADMVGMGRAMIADPELPNKAKAGRLDEIRECIACLDCYTALAISRDSSMVCAINAQVGRDMLSDLAPAEKPKKVLVVGGGPGGMEAARVAADRGHQVELWESGPVLGGQLLIGSIPPGKEELEIYRKYFVNAVNHAEVKVKTNAQVTADIIKRHSHDVVVLATGSKPLIPPIPGIDQSHVSTAVQILVGKAVADPVVVIGGGSVGTEVAEYLAEGGKAVTIVEMQDELAQDMGRITRQLQLFALAENNVKTVTGAKVQEITATAVVASKNGETLTIPAASVVLALGYRADTSLKDELAGQRVFRLGDCVRPRKILDAIREGFDIGVAV